MPTPYSPNQQNSTVASPSFDRAEPVIEQYFNYMNIAAYDQVVKLFANSGLLIAPFTKPLQGHLAILEYLQAEAKEMKLVPIGIERLAAPETTSLTQYRVQGKVESSLFTVNVTWSFQLNNDSEIETVEVKLLASFAELLPLAST